MKGFLLILIAIHCWKLTVAQDIPPAAEQQLENLTDAGQAETEDDSYLQQLEQFRKNPVDLNTADENELKELRVISGLQVQNFISYRKLFGRLINIYELQAVPSWDIPTIRKLLPFVTISSPVSVRDSFGERFSKGDHSLVVRISQVLENSRGFNESKYTGSPQKIFFRYKYSYKNLLQFGIVGDKDAGEQFFKGAQNKGFDFYSIHFFTRKIGVIQALAIGDYAINMGQGLIQWQGLAFKKSSDAMGIKRQSPVLRPYNSGGEFNFHRGIGITLQKGNAEATIFASIRNLSANLAADTISPEDFVSSFLMSGYHRTAGEIADKNSLQQMACGAVIKYSGLSRRKSRWHIGINGIYYHFSKAINKRDEPYNLFAIRGNRWYNFSVDYDYTFRNFHFFGEAAGDKNINKAFINGILISADPRIDISFLYRNIPPQYQSLNGNAFTENTFPTNEKGFYAGISIHPRSAWRIDAYADIYRFPWLKYLVDAPSDGKDFLIQLTYTPNKQVEIYGRYRAETKQGNWQGSSVTNYLIQLPRRDWRMQINYKMNPAIVLRHREELMGYGSKEDNNETGFLWFFDFVYRPLLKPWSGVLRLQYFETGGYNSRMYAYENDVLYSYSIPVFYDKGYRYYFALNYDVTKKLSVWLRWAQTIYPGKDGIGSGQDEINGDKRTEIKLQARYVF